MTLIFAALISMPLLTKVAIFGGVACGAWLLFEIIAKSNPRAEQRLDDFRDPSRRRGEAAGGSRCYETVGRHGPPVGKGIAQDGQAAAAEDRSRSRQAAREAELRRLPRRNGAEHLPGLKTICLGVGFVAGGGSMWFTKGATTEAIMYTVGDRRHWRSTCPISCCGSSRSRGRTTSSSACPMRST